MASSSSSLQQKYQVFLSFRGEDTRNNFTSHLHEALKRKGIDTFIDNRLETGEEISPALLAAIEESKISIIILSKNYASSSFCLDELSKILECKERNGQKVVPIFYHVDPSDIRNLKGTFAKAFVKHNKKRPDKVEGWSVALKKVADLAGHHLDSKKDRLESTVVEKIAKEISKDLMYKPSYDTKGLVGIDSHIWRIKSLLRINSVDVRIIGICGIGGIGKTTIAEVVYYQFFDEFEGCCFLNVKDELNRGGEVYFLKKLFSKVLEDENLHIDTSLLPTPIIDRLRQKKVFIVLDDVNNLEEIDLLRKKHYFGSGSRIIIISREKRVPGHVVDETYEVYGLIDEDALQLFSEYAFKQSCPKEDFMELSKKVIDYAKGHPLTLKVMGSFLNDNKSKSDWEGYLSRLKEILDDKIDGVLRISYDGLHDEEKNIFLDIACFFKGNDRDYVTKILDGCYISIMLGISVLIDKSLITLSDNKLEMHDLLQQMAWNIVRQESKRPEERSRLWDPKDIYHVLKNNKEAKTVESMILQMSKIRKVCLSSTAFTGMCNLRLLKFYSPSYLLYWKWERKVEISHYGLESLPDSLRYLHWDDYPSKSLPSNFCPENLVNLKLCNSHVERLWEGTQDLVNLKWLDLSGSEHLIELPDLSRATNLEAMIFWGCTSLVKVPSCINLRSLKFLNLSDCLKVTKFPEISENLESLYLNRTAIEEVPSSIGCLSKLKVLYMFSCSMLERLPISICKLKSLSQLELSRCHKLKSFPKILEPMECLKTLVLGYTSIEELPSSIEHLVGLEDLFLYHSEKLKNVSSSIKQLLKLRRLSLSYCKRLQSLPELPPNLKYLNASSCTSLEAVSSSCTIPHITEESQTEESQTTFIFSGCVKLDQNAISHILAKTLQAIHKGSQLLVCLPGSEIPECFNYQSTGSSITKQLEGFAQCTIVGYALCAVVGLEEDFVEEDFEEKDFEEEDFEEKDFEEEDFEEEYFEDVTFKVKLDNREWSHYSFECDSDDYVNSDTVFLGYVLCEPFHNELSFEVFVPSEFRGKVKKCGFYLLDAQNDPTSNKSHHDKVPRGNFRSDEVEEEPQPKRLKWNSKC